METGDKTAERLEMAAVKEGNHTLGADDIDWCVFQIDCLCEWHIVNFYLVILTCRRCVVASQIGHQMEPYSLSSVEILLSTWSVKQTILVNYYRCDMRYRINQTMVGYIAGTSDFWWNEGILISHSVVTNRGVLLHV
jgi:hypothetical protein